MQKLCVASSQFDLESKVNTLLNDGGHIVQGTSYAVAVDESLRLYCSIALSNHNGQVLVTASDMESFLARVKSFLVSGYWVIPGTIYITNLTTTPTTEKEFIMNLYSVVVGECV